MRRLLAPLSRWLDRRIDARITLQLPSATRSVSLQSLADETALDIAAIATLFGGER